MKRYLVLISAFFTLLGCQQQDTNIEMKKVESEVKAPVAKKIPYELSNHGQTRIDNYYWMRDDERKDVDVLSHLKAENEYADKLLAHTSDFQDKIFNELNDRMKKDDSSVPAKVNGYYYYTRYSGDAEYPVYARKKDTLEADEEVLLDGNIMAKDHDYFAIGSYAVSTNNQVLAYSTDTLSRRIYTIEFKYLYNDTPISDRLEQTSGQVIWANDNKTVYYIKKNLQTLLGYQVYRHKLGTPQSEDELVYEETNTKFYTSLGKTKDNGIIYIYHSSTLSKGASILDASDPKAKLSPFLPLEKDLEYSFAKLEDWYYIRTNWNAINFKIMKVHKDFTSDKSKWQEVIAHNEDVYLRDFELLKDYLLLREKVKGQTRIRAIHLKTNKSEELEFDEEVFVAWFSRNLELDTSVIRLGYSSMTTPVSIYDYDLVSKKITLLKQEEVLGEFHPQDYASERIFIKARDGKEVPVTIVYKKDKFKQDGTNPIYQYGYGSYGATMEPYFSISRLPLLDRGFVYALAHIRGGQMLGRPWYEDGKMLNKKNTFTDFIDVTKSLIKQKYGAKDKVFAAGGSAGGLLIGAIINMEPELYKGVGAHVPFVDVITTMEDDSIPLTSNEYDEWGNPAIKEQYDYMLSYSPYDQVQAQKYPNILVTTGLHDSQVQYFEPMKWVAKLRELKTDNNLLVFKTNMEAGHGGASGRFRRNKEIALEYAFFAELAGIKE